MRFLQLFPFIMLLLFPFPGLLPAILLYLLLFIETSICELIMMEKTKDGKGAGLHLDIVIISFINLICGLFGGPWICAATVRAVAHVSALTVFATSHIPGEPNKVVLSKCSYTVFINSLTFNMHSVP